MREPLVAVDADLLGARSGGVGRVGVQGEGARRGVGGEEVLSGGVVCFEEPANERKSDSE